METLRVPEIVPSPSQDCERLSKAFQGLGTDENAIIEVLGRRNASQRKKIRETYQQIYNKSLIDELQSELSGDFRKAVILWTYDPPERDARLANEALKSIRKGVNELQVLVEIACASSPHHLVAVRQSYCSLFDSSIEEDIISNVSVPLRKILISLVCSFRYDIKLVDSSTANSEAATLYEAIKRNALDNDDFTLILSHRNIFQLRETFKCYKQNYGSSIDEDILNCGKDGLGYILKVVFWCIDSPEKHFASVIRTSIDGLGTDEDSLTRVIVTRAEIDMKKAKEEYFKQNNDCLDKAVADDTSGNYKNFLMILLGANENLTSCSMDTD